MLLLLEGLLRLDVANDAVAAIELLEGKKVAVGLAAVVKLVATDSRSTTETVDNSLSDLCCCCLGSSL